MRQCIACTIALEGSYVSRGEVIKRDQHRRKYFDKGWLCKNCFYWMRKRGYAIREITGKDVVVYFPDGTEVQLSRERFSYIDKHQKWGVVKADCLYYAQLTNNVVHLVKMYSRPETFIEDTTAEICQLRLPF